MPHTFRYAVLRVVPDRARGECVNVGLVVFLSDTVDVRMLPMLGKISALDATLDLAGLLALPDDIRELHRQFGTEGVMRVVSGFGIVRISEQAEFTVDAMDAYDREVESLMRRLVLPVGSVRGRTEAHTKITRSLKTKFKAQRILGSKINDIENNLVVPNFPIDAEENLYAEFALRNGAYHFTETADFRPTYITGKDRTKIATLVYAKFAEAQRVFSKHCKRYTVYAAKSDNDVKAQLSLLARASPDGLFNLRSRQDMAAYMEAMMEAAAHTRQLSGH